MSRENVEIVRRAFDVFVSAGYDTARVEDPFELFDPGAAFDVSRTTPEGRVYHGQDGFLELMEQWLGTWDDYEVRAVEFIDAGPDRVVVVMHERGKLKGSDAWVEHTRGVVFTVHNQRIVRYEEHQDREQALEAAGLRE
jgi:ketosteroid isomerase-like protein